MFMGLSAIAQRVESTRLICLLSSGLPGKVSTLRRLSLNIFCIWRLNGKQLASPIDATIKFDESHYLAECREVPLYATGNTDQEAKKNLVIQIEELLEDLNSDDNLSDEWLAHKRYLNERVVNEKRSV